MGRYYDGDIEGKFWFGVQSSTAPENLGAEMMRITYQWSDRDALDKRIKELETELGDHLPKLDKFFDEARGYTDQMVAEALGITEDEVEKLLVVYADICLGRKVLAYLDEGNDYCEIDCEL